MKVVEYQDQAYSSAMYPKWAAVLYPLLGLIGEAGELVAKFHSALWPYGSPIPDGEEQYQEALTAAIGVGQRCEILKKQIRGGTDGLTERQRADVKEAVHSLVQCEVGQLEGEASDICWYINALLTDMNCDLTAALRRNLEKLAKRKAAGTIHNHKPDSREDRE